MAAVLLCWDSVLSASSITITVRQMADGSFNNRGLSLGLYLRHAEQFRYRTPVISYLLNCFANRFGVYHHLFVELTMHHTIEEQHIFPVLAKRMPSFRNDEAHLKSHHGIHEGTHRERDSPWNNLVNRIGGRLILCLQALPSSRTWYASGKQSLQHIHHRKWGIPSTAGGKSCSNT